MRSWFRLEVEKRAGAQPGARAVEVILPCRASETVPVVAGEQCLAPVMHGTEKMGEHRSFLGRTAFGEAGPQRGDKKNGAGKD